MNVLMEAFVWAALVITVYVIIAFSYAIWTLLKRRDESYRMRYEEFIKAKHRVQNKLKEERK